MSKITRLEDSLIQELLDNGVLHSELTRQLALNLQKERQESVRRGKVILDMRALISHFIKQHDVPTEVQDMVESTFHGPLEGHNLSTPLYWFISIVKWVEGRLALPKAEK